MQEFIETIAIIVGLALIVVLANLAEKRRGLRPLLYVILIAVGAIYTSKYLELYNVAIPVARLYAWTSLKLPGDFSVSPDNIIRALALSVGFSAITIPLMFESVRRRLGQLFPRRQIDGETGLLSGFDPASMVHMTGLIYCVYLLSRTVLTFVLAGGFSGLVGDFNITTGQLWGQLAIWLLFALAGVGFGVRRSLAGTAQRLGLRAPTVSELVTAGIVAAGLLGTAFILGIIWQEIAPRDVFEQQNALNEAITSSLTTLTLGFLVAFSAAVGEEIAFRGALQPVFGLWPTSILFAAIHIQYALTPASLLILLVALGLGWLRQRYNTTTSMVAHFLYNFSQIALVLFAQLAPAIGRIR